MPASGNTYFAQLQGSLCRAFGATSITEAGFVWCGGSLACHEAGIHTVTAVFSQIGVGENKLFSAHFFPTYYLS